MNAIPSQDLMRELNISAHELDKFRVYERLLVKWSKVKNLVSSGALGDLWNRHILDSAQVQRTLAGANVWLDFGSGAGFPGIVTAILLSDRSNALVHLVESDHRKCAFLRDVSRETGLKTVVHCRRIEDIAAEVTGVEAVSARAVAPMKQLLRWCEPLLINGATGVFPKGAEVSEELTRLSDPDRFELQLKHSLTHSDGRLVVVRHSSVIRSKQ